MKIEECGKRNGKTLLLLPGTGCSLVIVPVFTRIMNSGKLPKWLVKKYAQKHGEEAETLTEMVRMLGEHRNHFAARSMWNEFYAEYFRELFSGKPVEPDKVKEMMDYTGNDSTRNTSIADYVWLPIRFNGDVPYIEWMDEWTIEDELKR